MDILAGGNARELAPKKYGAKDPVKRPAHFGAPRGKESGARAIAERSAASSFGGAARGKEERRGSER